MTLTTRRSTDNQMIVTLKVNGVPASIGTYINPTKYRSEFTTTISGYIQWHFSSYEEYSYRASLMLGRISYPNAWVEDGSLQYGYVVTADGTSGDD